MYLRHHGEPAPLAAYPPPAAYRAATAAVRNTPGAAGADTVAAAAVTAAAPHIAHDVLARATTVHGWRTAWWAVGYAAAPLVGLLAAAPYLLTRGPMWLAVTVYCALGATIATTITMWRYTRREHARTIVLAAAADAARRGPRRTEHAAAGAVPRQPNVVRAPAWGSTRGAHDHNQRTPNT